MPRKSNRKKPLSTSNNGNSVWKGFVDVKLPDAHFKLMAESLPDNAEDLLGALYDLLQEGYKVSLGWHSDGTSVVCAVTGKHEGSPNYGYTLSSFGRNPAEALWATHYKVMVFAQGGLWKNVQYILPEAGLWG